MHVMMIRNKRLLLVAKKNHNCFVIYLWTNYKSHFIISKSYSPPFDFICKIIGGELYIENDIKWNVTQKINIKLNVSTIFTDSLKK